MGKKILFSGGGTSGHVSPLLSVIQAVKKIDSGVDCIYVGTKLDMSSPLIINSAEVFEKRSISAGKLHRFLTFRQVGEGFRFIRGLVQAESLIRSVKPDVIFCKGSMVSVPIAYAAKRHKIPLYSHETDVIPGIANRILARSAEKIFTAFPIEEYRKLPKEKLLFTGQPVREVFYETYSSNLIVQGKLINSDIPLITVIGGSQGAHRVNELVSGIWEDVLPKAQIIHICGSHDYARLLERSKKLSKKLGENLFLFSFVDNELPHMFAQSDVVISRSGGTIAELAAMKKATILIPLSTAAQDHQVANARVLGKAGAAVVLDETSCSSQDLSDQLWYILGDENYKKNLEDAIGNFAQPQAADSIAKTLLNHAN